MFKNQSNIEVIRFLFTLISVTLNVTITIAITINFNVYEPSQYYIKVNRFLFTLISVTLNDKSIISKAHTSSDNINVLWSLGNGCIFPFIIFFRVY
jgi:hypothetical protein